MGLTKTQRKNLREDGWTRRDIDDLEARLDEGGDDRDNDRDDDDNDRRSRRRSNGHDNDSGRVSVFEGAAEIQAHVVVRGLVARARNLRNA